MTLIPKHFGIAGRCCMLMGPLKHHLCGLASLAVIGLTGVLEGRVEIDPSQQYQIIEGFGASDAWNAEFVGRYFPEDEKRRAAKWLFSSQRDASGEPEGIGLSKWRFYLGAGSAEQGDRSGISNPTRRGSSFLDEDGITWNWERAPGQRWFLQQAVNYGVDSLLAFSIAPHISQSTNGLARSTQEGLMSNMKANQAGAYAEYLTTILRHFKDDYGIAFRYISPVNETQYPWNTSKQEGSAFTNAEVANIVRALDQSLNAAGLESRIFIPESADWEFLYTTKESPEHSDQIAAFFDPQSENYIGGLERVPNAISGHSYWLNRTLEETVEVRKKVDARAREFGISLHQSEYSLIEKGLLQMEKPQTRWETALFIARIIQSDLRFANVVSWSFWTAFEQDIWGTGNRYQLIRMTARDSDKLEKGGVLTPEKTMWALGQFSFFIRPGFQRIGLQGGDDLDGLLATAYLSPDGEDIVVVAVNSSSKTARREVVIHGSEVPLWEAYITDENRDLTNYKTMDRNVIEFPPESVVTLIGKIHPNN